MIERLPLCGTLAAPAVRNFASAAEAALWWASQGYLPIPIDAREKKPRGTQWQKLRITADDIPRFFDGQPQNIGVLQGHNGAVDLDLDCMESLVLAQVYAPPTGLIFGRRSKPASHREYRTDPPLRLQQFKDPQTKAMLVELRGLTKKGTIGEQTVVPCSTHVSGEPIVFERGFDTTAATVDPTALTTAARKIAAGSLLAHHWPASGRHDTMLALAGALARGGWTVEDALVFCRATYMAVPSHDRDAVARIDGEVNNSFDKITAGEPATGFPVLTEHIDRKVVEIALGWLGIKPQPQSGLIVAGAEWRAQLLLTEKGTIKSMLSNAVVMLRHAPEWQGVVAYNEFNLTVVIKKSPPWPESGGLGRVWTDDDDRRTACYLQQHDVAINTTVAAEAVQTVARELCFHPVKAYFEPLVWDQTERIDTWLSTYLGAQDCPYTRAVASRWLISGVARIYRPGCQADCVLLLEGPQGIMKSSALRTLASDEWFSDTVSSELGSKDSRLELHGVWIAELGECDRIKRGDLERVKSYLSARFDKFRPPYGRNTTTFARSCIFSATTNTESSFTDPTGNRRFWPVRCGRIDLEALKRDRDQLWAEALVRFRAGSPWWLETRELNEAATQAQDERYQPGIWDEQILNWCDHPEPREKRADDHTGGDLSYELPFDSSREAVTVHDVLIHGLGKALDRLEMGHILQVSNCLIHNGWTRLPQSRVKGTERRVRLYLRPGVTL